MDSVDSSYATILFDSSPADRLPFAIGFDIPRAAVSFHFQTFTNGHSVAERRAGAARYGLYDIDRLERMIFRRVTREYFLLDWEPQENDSKNSNNC